MLSNRETSQSWRSLNSERPHSYLGVILTVAVLQAEGRISPERCRRDLPSRRSAPVGEPTRGPSSGRNAPAAKLCVEHARWDNPSSSRVAAGC